MGMNTIKLWVGILLVFFLGASAGALGTKFFITYKLEKTFFKGPAGATPPPPLMFFLMQKLDRELDLTESQRTQVEKIMEEAMLGFSGIQEKYHPEMNEILNKSFERIHKVLEPGQRAKLKQFQKQLSKRWERKQGFRPDPREMYTVFTAILKERLNLTKNQVEDVKNIFEKAAVEFRKFQEENGPHMPGKMFSFGNKMEKLRKTTDERIEKILTEDQVILFHEFQKEHFEKMDKWMGFPPNGKEPFPHHDGPKKPHSFETDR